MKHFMKLGGIWACIFMISFILLWIAFGAIRLYTLKQELDDHIRYSEDVVENYSLYLQGNRNPPEEQDKFIIYGKLRYIKSKYLLSIDEKIREQENNLFFALIDVYMRQKILWQTHTFLLYAEMDIEVNGEKFMLSATDADIQFLFEKMEERREKTWCNPQPQSPPGILNERAFPNIETLQALLQELCDDYGTENDLLFKSFQAEASYFLSSYIEESSIIRWYQKPIYGWFPREGFITFRYIWLDISMMIGISFFVATFIIWWKYLLKRKK